MVSIVSYSHLSLMMIASWTQFHISAFNQEKALVGAFSVITNLRMELFEALVDCGQEQDQARLAASPVSV